jgi:hypothetical protein
MMGRLKSDQGQLFYEFRLGDAVLPRSAAEIETIVVDQVRLLPTFPRNHRPDLAQRPQIHQGLDRV